jgi:alpha-galactosidase
MKISFIGAGSTVFARNLIGDILFDPILRDAEISLQDLDENRLRETRNVALGLYESLGLPPRIQTTLELRDSLCGADAVLFLFQVGGYKPCTVTDFEIPREFGLRQTIGDTMGVGGIMRALRTIPVILNICMEIEELCPDALILNYVNSMAMNCMAVHQSYPHLKILGLCHSVQETIAKIAEDLGRKEEQFDFLCAGINHMSFFLSIHDKNGNDLYPELKRIPQESRSPENDLVRYEVLKHFGYFVTESSEHFAEYVPWFIKRGRKDLIEKYKIPLDEYPRRCEEQIQEWEKLKQELIDNPGSLEVERSNEYAASILRAYLGGGRCEVNANVSNTGCLIGLPEESCVEVPCEVSTGTIHPQLIEKFPKHLSALIKTNINVQELAVRAALDKSRESVYHAAFLDPHTAAELSLSEIRKLVDRLIEGHGAWIPKLH